MTRAPAAGRLVEDPDGPCARERVAHENGDSRSRGQRARERRVTVAGERAESRLELAVARSPHAVRLILVQVRVRVHGAVAPDRRPYA